MMLDNPFSGKELFALYHGHMQGVDREECDRTWEEDVGKLKKQTWNAMAKTINQRMRSESNYIKGELVK